MMVIHLYVDGSWWPHMHSAGVGVSMLRPDSTEFFSAATPIAAASPEESEYRAALLGLRLAEKMNARQVVLHMDCKFIVDRLNGKSFEPDEDLKPLVQDIRSRLKKRFSHAAVCYVQRDFNERADYLAKQGSRGRYWLQVGADICVAGIVPSNVLKPAFA